MKYFANEIDRKNVDFDFYLSVRGFELIALFMCCV